MSTFGTYLVHRGHKYIARIKGKNGKYRYFYSQEELQAYYDKLEKAGKELDAAEKRYDQAAKELEEAINTTGGVAGRQAQEALSKVRYQQQQTQRQRKKNQQSYENATRKAQAESRALENKLNSQLNPQNQDRWNRA